MIPKVANHLFHHTHRAVLAVQNQTGHTLRNVLQLQSSSGSSSAVTGWGSSVSSGSGHSGAGPSKFHATGRLHTLQPGTPVTSTQVRERVDKLSAFRVSSSQRSQHLTPEAASDPSQLVRSGFGTYATLISTLTDRDFENHEAVRRAEARLRRRRRAALDEGLEEEEKRIAGLRGDSNFKSALALFHTAAANPNSKFPLQVYNKLLRSCAIHANVDAAFAVYSHLENRLDIIPDAQTYVSLIETYANRHDMQGAESMFGKFKDASSSDRVHWSIDSIAAPSAVEDLPYQQRAAQTAVWNEMLAAYFRCGQATEAIGLLEQMMDAPAADSFLPTGVPLPTSATFARAVTGFCQAGDASTALAWFERMLQQESSSSDPHATTRVPHRPDASTWTTMFDTLADEGMVAEANRLFVRWQAIASQEGTAVWSDHRDSVLAANLKLMDTRADLDSAKAHELLDFLADHVLPWDIESGHFTFYRDTSRSLCQRLVMQYWNRGHTDEALDLATRIATRQLEVIHHGQATRKFDATQSQRRIEGTRRFAADLTSGILRQLGSSAPLSHFLRLSALLTDVGALVPAGLSESCLNAYALQRASSTLSLSTKEWEALLDIVASDADSAATLNTLVDDLLHYSVDITAFSDNAKNHLVHGLASHDVNSATLLAQLGEPFTTRLLELQRAMESSSPVSTHSFEPPMPVEEIPGTPLMSAYSSGRIDTAHSQHVGEFYPGGNKTSVLTAFKRFRSGADRGIFPRPIVLSRLISALGRLGEVDKIHEVYDGAQVVLNSLESMKQWQTSGWFLVEDHMIIGLAHAGDIEGAHAHRHRIIQQGGVPSADAYGALILHVKDTTDDTSNAMALFTESQNLGVAPNIFMYNTVISKLAKARKADFALQLFQDMKMQNIQPTSVTYGAVIAACCRVGDAASAELLFQEMTSEPTFKPRVPPYNTMMQLYTHTKPDRARVLHYYNELLAANVQPTAHTYKLLIDAYGSIEPIDVHAMDKVFNDLLADPTVSVQGTHWAALINAWGCVQKDLDKAIAIFDSIPTHTAVGKNGSSVMPDAVVYEAMINTLVTLRRMDLVPEFMKRLESSGVHMTAYIANLLIKGYASVNEIERSREVFESLLDPQEGVAAPHNHAPHQNKQLNILPVPAGTPVYREPSTWEAMVRAELGNGERDRAVALLQRLQARMFPPAVYQRISGIMLDDSVSPWSQSQSEASSSSPSPSSSS